VCAREGRTGETRFPFLNTFTCERGFYGPDEQAGIRAAQGLGDSFNIGKSPEGVDEEKGEIREKRGGEVPRMSR
jgi:hypothetical protein